MSEQSSRWSRWLLNLALVVSSLLVLVLLYALVVRNVMPQVDPSRADNPAGLVGEIIQVEVRNGAGEDGLAATTTLYLRRHGFDVVEVGDHEDYNVEQSIVIDRVGDPASARKVAAVLGIPEDRIREDIRLDYFLDASVIIGHDYAELLPFEAADAP